MVYIERTSKGEESYYFDADKLTRNDGISSEIDSSSDDNSGLEKILTSEDIQRAAENDTPDTTPNLSERFEFMQFLHLVEKLTNDNRDLQMKISNGQDKIEKLISENCELKLENYQLKLDVNKNSPMEVSVSTQTIVISEDCDPNKNASSQLLNNAGIVTGSENSKNQQAMHMKKKRPNKKQRAKKQKSQTSLDIGAAKNRETRSKLQNNAGKVTECEKSKATNNVIGSCSDGNDRGENETVRNESRSGSNAHVTIGSESKREETNNNSVGDSKKKICSSGKRDEDLTSFAAATKGKARTANKRSAVIIGDSMIKNINGWELKEKIGNNGIVHVKKFSGATIRDMHSYTIPTTEKKPNLIVLHVGTNDLPSRRGEEEKSEVQIAQEIIELANEIKENNIEVIISGLVARGDNYEEKRRKVNFVLADFCSEIDYAFIEHDNIDPRKHLNRSRLHLNKVGDSLLEGNLLRALRF